MWKLFLLPATQASSGPEARFTVFLFLLSVEAFFKLLCWAGTLLPYLLGGCCNKGNSSVKSHSLHIASCGLTQGGADGTLVHVPYAIQALCVLPAGGSWDRGVLLGPLQFDCRQGKRGSQEDFSEIQTRSLETSSSSLFCPHFYWLYWNHMAHLTYRESWEELWRKRKQNVRNTG